MAQRVTVTITDDLDGSEANETVNFRLDGVDYVIDLSSDNASRLRDGLRPFIEKARRPEGYRLKPRRPRKDIGHSAPGEQKKARKWAREQGLPVAPIGRLSAEIMGQYRAAQGSEG